MAHSIEPSKSSKSSKKTTVKVRRMLDKYKTQCDEMIGMIEEHFRVVMFSITEVNYGEMAPQKRRYSILDIGRGGAVVGDINISSSSYLYTDRSRSGRDDPDAYGERHEEKPAIYVSSLDVDPAYQGRGIGLALLFYGICKTYLRMCADNVYATYITLEDASDIQVDVKGNIYHKLGLAHVGHVQLYKKKGRLTIDRIDADGEKVGRIETFFGAAFPAYIKKYHPQNGGRRGVRFKTYRRKRYTINKNYKYKYRM